MTSPTTHRPFWKRKRLIAAAVLWLVGVYPLSAGPAIYGVGRQWLSLSLWRAVYGPVNSIALAVLPEGMYGQYEEYHGCWLWRGVRHREAAESSGRSDEMANGEHCPN